MTTGQGQQTEADNIDPSLRLSSARVVGQPNGQRPATNSASTEYDSSYITLDFGPSPPQPLSGIPFDVRFVGLDTDTPYVQVGEMFFKGTWSDIIGTEMIVGPDAENGGAKVIGMTRRRLVLEKVTLTEK